MSVPKTPDRDDIRSAAGARSRSRRVRLAVAAKALKVSRAVRLEHLCHHSPQPVSYRPPLSFLSQPSPSSLLTKRVSQYRAKIYQWPERVYIGKSCGLGLALQSGTAIIPSLSIPTKKEGVLKSV